MLTQARPVAPRPDAPDADPVGTKLARLEAKPSLDIDEVDYDVRDPDAVRARLAAPLAYSQRVEAMVTGLSIETLLPRTASGDGYINRFLTVWTPDEQGHALALERLLVALDIEPFPLPQDEPVPIHNRLAGLLGTMSASHARDRGARVPLDRGHERAPCLLRLRADVGDPHRAR